VSQDDGQAGEHASRHATPRYKSYLIAALLVVLAFNCADRLALGLVLQDIKIDMRLSDSQLGVLSGIAFALFYSVMGIPIARWADKGNRVTIITLSIALWGVSVALCGRAASFTQLMLTRIVVGVGESGCMPPAHSLIADYFSRTERPRAVSRYMQGISLSLVIGYFVAGWLNQLYGWREMFVLIGLPGVMLAVLTGFSLKEPRGRTLNPIVSTAASPSLREVGVTLWTNTTFRHLVSAFSVMYFFSTGILQWTPAFFVRSFGLKSGVLGNWFVVIYGVGCVLGTYWGGEWVARHAVRNERRQLLATMVAVCISGLFGAMVYLPVVAPNQYWAFAWLGLSTVFTTMINGPLLAVIQTLVPDRMRAVAIALLYFFANLIGLGLGPLVTGVLSDMLRPRLGGESLRCALLVLTLGNLWLAWHLSRASRTVMRDVEAIQIGAVPNDLY
jgi:MFS family permease